MAAANKSVGSKVLDFIKGEVRPIISTGVNAANDIAAPARGAANFLTEHTPGNKTPVNLPTPRQTATSIPGVGNLVDNGGLRSQLSDLAQTAIDVSPAKIAGPVERFALPITRAAADIGEQAGGKALDFLGEKAGDIGAQIGRKIAGGAAKGAIGGATIGGAQGVAQGVGNAQNPDDLAMDFIQGAGKGAEQGAVFGAASTKSSPMNEADAVGGIGSKIGRIFSNKMQGKAGLVADDGTVDGYNSSDELVKDAADMYQQTHAEADQGSVLTKIRQRGGISSSDYEDIPSSVKNKNGLPMDELAEELGYNDDSELYNAMQEDMMKGKMPTTKAGWQEYAKDQLASGKAMYGMSDTYAKLVARENGGSPIDDQTASDLAGEDNISKIQDKLESTVGPVVAKDVAGAVSQTKDPNIVKEIVNNGVQSKLQLGNTGGTVVDPYTGETREPSMIETQLHGNDINAIQQKLNSNYEQYQTAMLAKQANETPQTSTSDITTPQEASAGGQISPEEEQSLMQSGEQLGKNDIREQPPAFLNAPGESNPTHVSNLATMERAKYMLEQGASPEAALQHIMESTNGDAYTAGKLLNNVMNSEGFDKSKVNANLNPMTGKVAVPQASNAGEAIANRSYFEGKVRDAGQTALNEMQQLNPHDLELVRDLRGRDPAEVITRAQDQEQFARVAQALKDYNDYTHSSGNALGQQIPYLQRYGLHTPYVDENNVPAEQSPLLSNPNKAGYQQQRLLTTHEMATLAGFHPANETALQDLQQDINMRAGHQGRLALEQGLKNVYGDEAVKRINGGQLPAGYHQLLIPGGDHLALPGGIADKLNARQMYKYTEGTSGKIAKAYDAANSIGKQSELGGGFFHGFNTASTFVGQQLASAKTLTDFGATTRVVQNFLSDHASEKYFDNASDSELNPAGGVDNTHSLMDAAHASRLNLGSAEDVAAPEDKGLAGKVASIPGLKQIHKAVFKRQIPTMMLETFRQQTQGLDVFGSAADRDQAFKIAQQINKEFGTIDHDVQGLTPKQFKIAGRVLLAPSYQEGQMMSLYDALTKGGAEGKLARQAVFGKALLFGGLATLGAAAGGDFKGQTPKQVALSIMHKMVNPEFNIGGYTVSTPSTPISEIGKPINKIVAAERGGKNTGQSLEAGLTDFAKSRAAFLPAQAQEQMANQNFQGNALHGSDYYGRPINAEQDIANALSNVAPIPVQQAEQLGSGQENLGAAAANLAGLNTYKTYTASYAPVAGQTYLGELEKTPGVTQDQISADTEYFDLLEQGVKGKNKAIQQAATAINQKNPQKANQIIQNYNQQLVKALMPWAQDKSKSQYLDTTMLQLLQTAELKNGTISRDAQYYAKTNPTAYGATIKPLASNPVATPAAS